MDREDGELFRDDLESDLNSTAAVAPLNASEVARVNVGVGGVATGIALYVLSFLTFVGNAMVLHAIRTEKRLQTVSDIARDGEWNALHVYVQGRAKLMELSLVTHVPSGPMGCAWAGHFAWQKGGGNFKQGEKIFAPRCTNKLSEMQTKRV